MEVFGRVRLNEGLKDEDWLPVVGRNGWVIFGRDWHILDREYELQAYLSAAVHMFLLPGEATREQLTELLAANLGDICVVAVARQTGVYWLTPRGLVTYERRRSQRERRRQRRKSAS
jgi:hypothetical protein